jgi:hypothetical protein
MKKSNKNGKCDVFKPFENQTKANIHINNIECIVEFKMLTDDGSSFFIKIYHNNQEFSNILKANSDNIWTSNEIALDNLKLSIIEKNLIANHINAIIDAHLN